MPADRSQPLYETQEVEGIPSELQGLVFAGRQLSQGCALAEYGISSGSTVHLCLRLRGGKGGFGALLRGQGRDGKVTTNFDAMRDLQGRRLRHKFAEEKLAEWKAGAKERELEKIAQQHIKELARQQRKQEHEQVRGRAVALLCCWGAQALHPQPRQHIAAYQHTHAMACKCCAAKGRGSKGRKCCAAQRPVPCACPCLQSRAH